MEDKWGGRWSAESRPSWTSSWMQRETFCRHRCHGGVVGSGNELVGQSRPILSRNMPDESWDEAHGAQGDIREIASGTQRALRVLAGIRNRPRSGFVSIVLGNNAPVYHLPAAFNDLNEYFAGEARRLSVHTLDIKQLLDRAEFKDHYDGTLLC